MKNKKIKTRKIFQKISGLFLIPIFLSSFILAGCSDSSETQKNYRLELEVWGVYDDSDAFSEINAIFAKLNPRVAKVNYKKISSSESGYEEELVKALASGKGPDVILLKNSWLWEHNDKLAPLPDSTTHLPTFRKNFVQVAEDDFVEAGYIFAMPLYCDTLALYYNKDILNQAGIVAPPETWNEVKEQTQKITKIDSFGNITQSAIALGRSNEPGGINRAGDILMLLMLQAGTKMNSSAGQVVLDEAEEGSGNPGLEALGFYLEFAQADQEIYNWNTKMPYSVDSFMTGKTAMMLSYAYMAESLEKKNAKLNFDVAPVPQINTEEKVNFASYWGLAVIKNKSLDSASYTNDDRINEAWEYVKFVTEKFDQAEEIGLPADPIEIYLAKTEKPTARRDLIEKQKDDLFLRVFADQVLTAKSWRRPEETKVDEIFMTMIDDAANGEKTPLDALKTGQNRINNLR